VDIPRGAVEPHEVTFRQGGDHHEERIKYGEKSWAKNGNSMGKQTWDIPVCHRKSWNMMKIGGELSTD
jgi:hypothetical protein